MSQEDFSAKLGLALSTYQYLEQGKATKISISTLEALASLGVDMHWLLTGKEPKPKPAKADQEKAGRDDQSVPPFGYDLVRLPRGDPEPLDAVEADALEKTLVVLRAKGEAEHFGESLLRNVNSFHRGVLVTERQTTESGQVVKKSKAS